MIDLSKTKPGFCFKPDLRQAVREGRKGQTRRLHDCKHKVGDVLYLREPLIKRMYIDMDVAYYKDTNFPVLSTDECPPKGDINWLIYPEIEAWILEWKWERWTLPQIHMPKIAARTFYRITEVRRERLQDITEDDAEAEGVEQNCLADCEYIPNDMLPYLRFYDASYRVGFFKKWCEINGPDSWDENPEVWVYSFELVEGGAQ